MSIVQSLCMETITQEPTLAADQPGAMLGLKPDAIKDKLRLGMAALVHDIVFLYRLLRHPKTSWYVRGMLILPVMYLCSPIQLIPSFIPVIGQMDDVFVIWITKKTTLKLVDEKILQECHDAAAATELSIYEATRTYYEMISKKSTAPLAWARWRIFSSDSGA